MISIDSVAVAAAVAAAVAVAVAVAFAVVVSSAGRNIVLLLQCAVVEMHCCHGCCCGCHESQALSLGLEFIHANVVSYSAYLNSSGGSNSSGDPNSSGERVAIIRGRGGNNSGEGSQ